jgi:thiamine-phosphate pyrophosphorylase
MTTPAAAPGRSVPRLHVLTDAAEPAAVLRLVEAIVAAGAPAVQVRVKDAADRDWFELATRVAARCRDGGALCIVNDRADIAVAAGADGVHLGADDLPVSAARAVVGPDLLVGATARDADQARAAVADGADYLGVGPVHATQTKAGLPTPIGTEGLAEVTRAVDVPILAIAGMTAERTPAALAAGAHGVAVTGAVTRVEDPAAAVRDLLAALDQQ